MFREDKATQMAARFLDLAGGRISYVKLLKLLYLADKQMLVERGHPITYDRWYAMKHGPILSATYDLIQGKTAATSWSEYICTDQFDLVLKGDPGSDDLSRAEDRIIDAVFEKYKDHKTWVLVSELHEELNEWENPGSASCEMTYKSVLQHAGFGDEDIENILENIEIQNDLELVLGNR
jgi:uncharacterized phage-associated protein